MHHLARGQMPVSLSDQRRDPCYVWGGEAGAVESAQLAVGIDEAGGQAWPPSRQGYCAGARCGDIDPRSTDREICRFAVIVGRRDGEHVVVEPAGRRDRGDRTGVVLLAGAAGVGGGHYHDHVVLHRVVYGGLQIGRIDLVPLGRETRGLRNIDHSCAQLHGAHHGPSHAHGVAGARAVDLLTVVELAQRHRVEGAGLPDGEYLRSRGDPDESAVGIRRRGDEASYYGAVTVAVEQAGAVFDVVAAIDQSADKPGMRLHPAVDDGDSLVASGCVLLGLPDPQPPLRWRLDLEVLRVVRDRLLAGCLLLDRTRLP